MHGSFQDTVISPLEAREKALGLRELRYFLSVAQTGNVGRTALALNISQPAISMQLRKLEERLGTQLLLRHGRGVTLTAAGICLRDRARIAMQLLTSPMTPTPTPDAREMISLAVTAEMGSVLGPPLVKAFRAHWPDLRLAIREGQGSLLEEWMTHRQVDVAILEDPPTCVDLELVPVLSENLGIVGPIHSNLEQNSRLLPVRELACYPLILPHEQHWLRRRLERAVLQRGVRLSLCLEVDSIPVINALVRSGVGFSVLPYSPIREEVRRGKLAFRSLGQPILSCNTSIAFFHDAAGARIPSFVDMVRYVIIMLAKEGAWPGAKLIANEP
ncbi:MAG TPA: LysR family transcriptional regulator [Acetobacteraceae bacterium]|nr:LysR family transcriptional regulator [Acetobacteraceae bacterium]